MNDDIMRDFARKLPKTELHAHLNGSLSKETLKKLCKLRCNDSLNTNINLDSFSSYSECFQIFELIHKLTDNLPALHTATEDVIREFYNDGVYYLELRTTPKEIAGHMTRIQYVDTVLSAIETTMQTLPDMKVKLLLSVDRKNTSISAAEEILQIARSKFNSSSSIVVGMDLCGDANTGDVSKYIPIFQFAKNSGLKLSFHLAEVPDRDAETEKLLQLEPHRIGHGTFIHTAKGGLDKNFETVKNSEIPLEICLTSNVACRVVSDYEDHHFPLWSDINHPCIICTDDKGVFNTTLSTEFYLAQKHFLLTEEDLWELSFNSINYSFATENEQRELKTHWQKQKKKLFDIFQK